MDLSGYAAVGLLFLVAVYTLQICARDFREARKARSRRAYLYLICAVLALAVIAIGLLVVLFSILGPFH
ncbi:MAG: hypothetical protein DMG37_17370 [Acidobacteria bacterium]|nr:MAG: hypothetical protein DMG37_17370 [Acidobacteriota bacterium]